MNALVLTMALSASPDGGIDVIKDVLLPEIARAKTLKLPATENEKPADPPYWVGAFVNELETYDVRASFGALTGRGQETSLQCLPRVRVGNKKFDDSNFADRGSFSFLFGDMGGRGRLSPAELDVDLLRHALWLGFDDAYKSAVERLAKKRAFVQTISVAEPTDDFGPAPVFTFDRPRVPVKVDADQTAALTRRTSAVFLENPLLQEGTAWYRARSSQQTFASSEGAMHRLGEEEVFVQLAVSAQAADGMDLRLRKQFNGHDAADLPSEAELIDAAKKLSAQMTALAKAPVADEDYSGPVLFVDQAAALFFLSSIGDPLSNPREPLGARVEGRMIERLGKRVAAKFLSATDDPTVATWNDGKRAVPLWGAFPVDDDGVQSQRVGLIESGVLKKYYMSRTPTARLKETNGHARGVQGGVGNLFVTTTAPTTRAQLKKRMLELAKDEDLDYGLMVESMGETVPRNASDLRLSAPVLIWKVYADGREVLVRGLSFKTLSGRVLKELEAMGDDPSLLNLEHRGQRTSVVAPSVLVKLMDLTRTRQDFEKPPVLPRP
ncbi:MAG: hypothetical protein JNM17_33150 [Archangium sp.]|nr:hypothetical protein [Archangium sp.]